MFISQVCYFVLVSIGAVALAYSPVIVLGLYMSLHEDQPAWKHLDRLVNPKASNE
jgi:hypothetical protein